MKFSIRTRLTLLTTLIYVLVFFFLLAAGAIALFFGLNEEIDKALKAEKNRVVQLLDSKFPDLLTATGQTLTFLKSELLEDLVLTAVSEAITKSQ
ncbi:MAG: hypothetical protein ACE5HX_14415, partial [bacterium]